MNAYRAVDKLNLEAGKRGNILVKVIKSALANAKNNNKLDANNMVIKSIEVLKGPFAKRWQPVSKGMAHSIKKRTAHLKIVLTEKADKPVMIVKAGQKATKKDEIEESKKVGDKPEKSETHNQEQGLNSKVQK